MAGNQVGGKKTAIKNKANFGEDYFAVIGQIGGLKSRGGGFTNDRARASKYGKIGGTRSRRGPSGSFTPKKRECTWCGDKTHLAYSCELRAQVIANRKVREEQHQEQRDKMSDIAKKHGVKRPW